MTGLNHPELFPGGGVSTEPQQTGVPVGYGQMRTEQDIVGVLHGQSGSFSGILPFINAFSPTGR